LKIIYSRSAAKAIESLDKAMKQRIKTGIEGLTEVPPVGDIKMMQGTNPPGYRLRIGKYRVLYEYTNIEGEQVLMIKDIGSRGNIYK
jgi:mRNA interferase RelE/StbE